MNVDKPMARVRVANPGATSPAPQTQVTVTVGALRPIDDYINWDPFIVAR